MSKTIKGSRTKKTSSTKKTQKKRNYVLDANFFIALKKIKVLNILENLRKVRDEIGIKFYITNTVYNEIPFMKGARSRNFKNTIDVISVTDIELSKVKKELDGLGVKSPAQDPDLTLVALSKKLKIANTQNKVYLVSDDFKLSENVKMLNYGIDFLSLSAFLLYLSRNSRISKFKMYFKDLRQKTLKYTLNYMMDRHQIYNAQSKLMWLIEKAVSVAEDGISISGIDTTTAVDNKKFKSTSVKDIRGTDKEYEKILQICNSYIQKKSLKSNDLEKIVILLPLLDKIKKGRIYITNAKSALREDNHEDAVEYLQIAKNLIMNSIQKAGSLLPEKRNLLFQQVASAELSKLEFLRAFLLIGSEDFPSAFEALNASAMFSTLAKNTKSVLAINYLKALLNLFNENYEQAMKQFNFTRDLAINYTENELLILKCSIGKAITQFMSGMDSEAMDLIDEISDETGGEKLESALIVFSELGDYFYTISKPAIAISLYNEALECAVDSKDLEWRINSIMEKLKKAYMNALLEAGTAKKTANIETILDRAHELQNVERYNEEIGKLAQFNRMFYEDFPVYTGKGKNISYFDIDKKLRETFDVIDIIKSSKTETTVLIAFNSEIGLVGFRVKLPVDMKLEGIPENYKIKLTKKAKVQILKPSQKLKVKYLLRAIIVVSSIDYVDIDRNIPIFFSQMNI